ncbi:hypothetical protein SAMN05444158_4000 [Bradyrhizobium canariense]|uniref:Uncharacterized protein n=1 Tax=Bradyrhizobium canariense TaxID=255045 RepID=A0A1H1WSP6_9BRAD|nr:hypothetical protein SAMN05444158_4000 [Bradyrhizobium canariense]
MTREARRSHHPVSIGRECPRSLMKIPEQTMTISYVHSIPDLIEFCWRQVLFQIVLLLFRHQIIDESARVLLGAPIHHELAEVGWLLLAIFNKVIELKNTRLLHALW